VVTSSHTYIIHVSRISTELKSPSKHLSVFSDPQSNSIHSIRSLIKHKYPIFNKPALGRGSSRREVVKVWYGMLYIRYISSNAWGIL
jgi:hypothetical protein